jgi:hypothetical protein
MRDIRAYARSGRERRGTESTPNLAKPFKNSGGKLHPLPSPERNQIRRGPIIDVLPARVRSDGRPRQTRDFARCLHGRGDWGCDTGFGNPQDFDALEAVQQWVEKRDCAGRILARHRNEDREVFRTRPVCAYPAVARYKGSGDPDDAANFVCR